MILQVFSKLGDSMIQFYRKYYCNKYRIALDRWRKRGFLCTCSLSLCSSVVQPKLECFSYISAVFHNNWSTDMGSYPCGTTGIQGVCLYTQVVVNSPFFEITTTANWTGCVCVHLVRCGTRSRRRKMKESFPILVSWRTLY